MTTITIRSRHRGDRVFRRIGFRPQDSGRAWTPAAKRLSGVGDMAELTHATCSCYFVGLRSIMVQPLRRMRRGVTSPSR
jgi:hypothetical protein